MSHALLEATLLDLRGMLNPEPVLSLAEAAGRLQPGGRLEVLSDDPCAVGDFVRWSASTDVALESIDYEREGVTRFVFVRRNHQRVA